MLSHGYDWLIAYLNGLRRDEAFVAAQDTATLPLRRESDDQMPGQVRTTLQEVAAAPQLAFIGPAGAGKTTLLRQMAAAAADACLDGLRRGLAADELPPIPILFDVARLHGTLEASLAAHLGPSVPPLSVLTQRYKVLLLLDSLDRLPASAQLSGLAAIRQTLIALGGRVRWAVTCRSDMLDLFRPWLDNALIYQIEPLSIQQVREALEHVHGPDTTAWLGEQHDLIELARRPRWLSALLRTLTPHATARGPLLTTLMSHVLMETAGTRIEGLLRVLPELAASIEQHGRALTPMEAQLALADCADSTAMLRLMLDAGILVEEPQQQQISFAQPLLFDLARALGLAQVLPRTWPDVALTRPWRETLTLAFGLHGERIAVLSWLLDHEAAELTARCLAETLAPEQFETFLAKSGGLTPAMRVRLADAFTNLGLSAAAIAQLERSGADGYEETGLFRRLGDLYAHTAQWRHARVAYTQVLAREPDDLRYRKRLGIACSRLGEYAEAEVALQSVIASLRQIQAEAAAELGHVYATQGRLEIALAAYQQAVAAQPGTPAYHRGMATTLHRLGRSAAAEDILRDLLSVRSDDAEAHADLGQIYADTGRREQAIESLARSTALRPDEPRYYAQIGQLRMAIGDPRGAWAAFQRATQLSSDDATLHVALGDACAAIGDQAAALAAYRRATQLDPRNDRILRRLGVTLGKLAAYDEGIGVLREALTLRQDSAETLAELGHLLQRQGDGQQALGAYQQAIALAPKSAEYELGLGLTYRELGQSQEAAHHLNRAIELAPDRADIHAAIAAHAAAHEQWAVAAAAYGRATRIDRANPEYPRAAAECQLHNGSPELARSLLAESLRRQRTNLTTWLHVGRLHALTGNPKRAIRALRRAGQSVEVLELLGKTLHQVGQMSAAIHVFAQALLAGATDPDLLENYSRALADAGQLTRAYDIARRVIEQDGGRTQLLQHASTLARKLERPNEALTLIERALALNPTLATAHAEYGRIWLAQGQPQRALDAARSALAIAPNLGAAALTAALALVRLGHPDAARPLIEQALTLDPSDAEAHAAQRDLLAQANPAEALIAAQRVIDLAPNEPQHHLRRGELLLAQGEYASAMQAFEVALTINPRLAAAHAWLSRTHAQTQSWNRARYHAEQALLLAPEIEAHTVLVAEAAAGAGDLVGAAKLLADAIGRRGERAEWSHALGLIHLRRGDTTNGLASLRKTIQLDPQRSAAYRDLGQMLASQGDQNGAAAALTRAIQLNPDMPAWRGDLAKIQMARGWYAEALAELDQAIALIPHDVRLLRLRASTRLQLGQADHAQADLIAALRRSPDDLPTLVLFAKLMADHGQISAAIGAARRATTLSPDDAAIRHLFADVLRRAGKPAEAAEQIELVAKRTKQATDWAMLADDWHTAGQPERARLAWERAMQAAPDDGLLLVRYGTFLLRSGNLGAAQAIFTKATELYPDLALAQVGLAELLTLNAVVGSATDLDLATLSARRATALDPESAATWMALGAALWRSGQAAEALEILQQARRIASADPEAAALFGCAALTIGEIDQARTAFEAATQLSPTNAAYQIGLALALRTPLGLPIDLDQLTLQANSAGDLLVRAEQAITQAMSIEPNQPRWWFEHGIVAQLRDQHTQALDHLARCLNLPLAASTPARSWPELIAAELGRVPTASDVLLRCSVSWYALGQYDDAAAALDSVLAEQPTLLSAAELRGLVAAQRGEAALARDLLTQVTAKQPAHWRSSASLGRVLLELGQPGAAIAPLEHAAELRPADAGSAALLADAYIAAGKRDRAISASSKAARLEPRGAEHHHRLATLYTEAGRLQEARAALMTAITLQANRPDWHVQMAQICAGMGMHEAARNALRRAITLAPDQPSYRYELARLLADQGQEEEARATLQEVVAQAPERGEWRSELGRLYAHLGDHESALSEYEASVQYSPDQVQAWLTLADAQAKTVGSQAALETIERAITRFGDDVDLHAAAGALLEQQGMTETATWHYHRAVEADPQRAEPWWRLGRSLIHQEKPAEALAALEQALSLDPRAAQAHALKAQLLATSGDVQAALYHGRTAAALSPDDTTILVWVGEALLKLRRFDDAYQLLARAVARQQGDALVLALCGDAALASGREDTAVDLFDRAIKLQPNDATLHYRAGLAHRRLKHYSRAIACLRRAVKLRANYGDAIRELSTLGPLAFFTQYGEQAAAPADETKRVDDLPSYDRPDRRS